MVRRYDFKTFPTKAEDFDLQEKGARFESGKAGEFLIDSLVVYSGAILVDTLASSDVSKRILSELLEWGREELGLSFEERLIRRWGYISQVVFKSSVPLLAQHSSPVQKLAAKASAFTEEIFDGLKYEASQIWIGHDPMLRKHSIAGLMIAHRVNTLFSENTFFSEAPLPTNLHLQFLTEFERDVMQSMK